MRIEYNSAAAKELKKIGPASKTIRAKVRQHAADPASLANNVKALKASDMLRLRVSDHRVIFTIENDTMVVLKVRIRGRAYD